MARFHYLDRLLVLLCKGIDFNADNGDLFHHPVVTLLLFYGYRSFLLNMHRALENRIKTVTNGLKSVDFCVLNAILNRRSGTKIFLTLGEHSSEEEQMNSPISLKTSPIYRKTE